MSADVTPLLKQTPPSRGTRSVALRALAWLVATAVCTACTLVYDADRKQCSSAADCQAQGFEGSICVEGVCQPASGPPGGLGDASSTTDAVTWPFNDAGRTDAATMEAGTLADSASGPLDAGGVDGGSGQSSCEGSGCPECSINLDCERRGIPGAVCADSKCWAAPAAQCASDDTCIALGPEYVGGRCLASQCRPNPRWRCEHPPVAQGAGTKQLTLFVRDSLSLDPVIGVRAQVCQKLDLRCATPIGEATTNAGGNLEFSVPAAFAGYLKIEGTSYFPAMYFLPAALPGDGVLQPFPLLKSGLIVDALAVALGTGIDARRGHMMLISEDCLGAALPGVSFKSPQQDTSTVQFYVRDLLPSTDATETAEIGNGGYLNFPAGTAVINLEQVSSGLPLTTVSVVVRAGFISVAYIRPDLR